MNKPDTNKSRARLEQREAKILEAATSLFASEGFHGTSTRKIAAAAGVSEGTLFHYFSTKNVLLMTILNNFYGRLTESAQAGVQEIMDTQERLLFIATNHLEALLDNQALMSRLIQVYLSVDLNYYRDYRNSPIHELNYRYTRIFDNVIKEGIERGNLKADLELSAIRDLFFGGLEYGMRTLLGRNSADNFSSYVEAIINPLWLSLQNDVEAVEKAHSAGHSERAMVDCLEAACKRIELAAANLENAAKLDR